MRFHDVRHTTATLLLKAGVPIQHVQRILRHSNVRTTVDTYGPTEQAQAVMYTASGLTSGSHTLMVKVTGTWSASSTSAWVVVDAFDVQ